MTAAKFSKIAVSAALGILLVGSQAWAGEWKHISLQSKQGVKINIDYQLKKGPGGSDYKPQYPSTATPLYVNVSGPGIDKNSEVRVVFRNFAFSGFPLPRRGSVPQEYVLDLKPSASSQYGLHMSGEMRDAKVKQGYLDLGDGKKTPVFAGSNGYGGRHVIPQDIAVVVGKKGQKGTWQEDPINHTHNFQLELGLAK